MRFCERCRDARGWPKSAQQRRAVCAVCGRTTSTHDVPRRLKDPVMRLPMGVTLRLGDEIEHLRVAGRFRITKIRPRYVEAVGGVAGHVLIRSFKPIDILPITPYGRHPASDRPRGKRRLAPERAAIVEAIHRTGEVRVALPPDASKLDRKRIADSIYGCAYTLGLKRRFKVHLSDDVAHGYVVDVP